MSVRIQYLSRLNCRDLSRSPVIIEIQSHLLNIDLLFYKSRHCERIA